VKSVNILFLVLCFIFCQNINAQREIDHIKRMGFRYLHQHEMYNKHDIGLVLKKDTLAFELYQRTIGIRQKAKICGISSLSLLGLGVGSILIGNESSRCAFFTGRECPAYIIGPIALATGILTGLASFSMYSDAGIKRNKAVRIYNENARKNRGFGYVPIRLNLKIDTTKVGLVLKF